MSNGLVRGFGLLHAVALAAIMQSRAPWVAAVTAGANVAHLRDVVGGGPR